MKMRFPFVLMFLSICLFKAKANSVSDLTDSISDLKIENQQIIYNEKVVGNVSDPIIQLNDNKSEDYKVQIFGKKGRLVAEYRIEVLSKKKKNQDEILTAQIKTTKDNVVHNGNNFVDFHQRFSIQHKESILQLDKVVKYLLTYKYL